MSKFIIICGGTGGHLVPGIAIGKALLKAGHEVSFVISTKNVDAVLMKKYSDLHVIKTPGCAFSKNPIKFFKFLAELTKSIRFGIKTLKDGNYDLVMSFGGFNSLGFSIAALMLKIPLILHEANRKAGKATRLLGKFAKRIYVPYGVKIPRARVTRVKYAGYPLRDEIVKQDIVFAVQNEVVKNLNKGTFTVDDISEDSYYKTYGTPTLALKNQIEKAIKEKFNEKSDIIISRIARMTPGGSCLSLFRSI